MQFNIKYKPKIMELDSFINQYQNHRINLIIQDFHKEEDLPIILALQNKYPNAELVVCLPFFHEAIEELFNSNNIKHYYNEFITSWDKFHGFLSLNVTDIFIAEELAFSAKILSKNAKEKGKSLRAFCNVCQSSWDKTPSLKTFFIRPEDIDKYEGIIDTFEFYVDTKDSFKINTLYEVYTKTKKWYGKLSEIIVGYKGEEDSRYILPSFGEQRLNCGKTCSQNLSNHCRVCDKVKELEELLRKEHIIFARQEDYKEQEKEKLDNNENF